MKKLLSAVAVVGSLLIGLLAAPAAADAPVTEPFTGVNDENAVDPCTGDPMVVEITGVVTIHDHHRSIVVHGKASGGSGDYVLHHGNMVNISTGSRSEGRLVEFYNGPGGSKIRIAIRFTFTGDGPPNVVFTSQCQRAPQST